MNGLTIAGTVLAAVAALIHVYIFVLESVRWTAPATRKVFGVRSAEDAELMRPLAFNQGFYNLFLALGAAVGIVLIASGGAARVGYAVAIFALACMALAAVVLVASNPRMLRAALLQGVAPLAGVVLLALGAVAITSG
jgi:putative membrane protein